MFAIPEVGYTLYNLSNHIVKLSNEVLFREKGERGNVEKRRNAKKRKMLKRGIEPQTFALLARRSNQLSYSSLLCSLFFILSVLPFLQTNKSPSNKLIFLYKINKLSTKSYPKS